MFNCWYNFLVLVLENCTNSYVTIPRDCSLSLAKGTYPPTPLKLVPNQLTITISTMSMVVSYRKWLQSESTVALPIIYIILMYDLPHTTTD